MIPKVIHYIWLGKKPLPKIAKKCIKSWKKYCPNYKIKKWNEKSLNLNECNYAKQAYHFKKFAFASDYFRYKILYDEGGIYLDIDVELLKPLDELINSCSGFIGYEHNYQLNPGSIMAAEKNLEFMKDLYTEYLDRPFIVNNEINYKTICEYSTEYFVKHGLKANNENQVINNFNFYSSEYFAPLSYETKEMNITSNTISIHWYNGSWFNKEKSIVKIKRTLKNGIKKFIKLIIGKKFYNFLKRKLKKDKNQ